MTEIDQLAWLAGSVAVLAAIASWLPWLRGTVNHAMFTRMVLKLLAAGNEPRARKLCHAAPGSPFVVAVLRALVALDDHRDEPDSEAIARVRREFGDVLRAEMARAAGAWWTELLALVASAVAGYLVLAEGAHLPTLILPAFAVGVLIHARQITLSIARAGAIHGEELFPAMVAARTAAATSTSLN